MWTLDASDGELVLRTGVVGRAARLGHRLTIAMTRWQALVNWSGTDPVAGELVAEVDSFEVMRGEGGVKGLSEPEKALVRANALKTLNASRFPHIRFTTEAIAQTGNGYRLTGKLHIRGKSQALGEPGTGLVGVKARLAQRGRPVTSEVDGNHARSAVAVASRSASVVIGMRARQDLRPG